MSCFSETSFIHALISFMRSFFVCVFFCLTGGIVNAQSTPAAASSTPDSIGLHKVVLDDQSKLISWMGPSSIAYDLFLRKRWEFVKKAPNSPGPPPRSLYPQYYFYCAFQDNMEPDQWMNDIGEKIPNWFESARLYYAYTGDASVMKIVKGMMDYAIEHGTSPDSFDWPGMPYTTTNAGDTVFQGFTSAQRFVLHEIQVDHAGDMGSAYYRMYLFTGEEKYKEAALKVANTMAAKIKTGNAKQSPLPYRVVMNTGKVTAPYGANWANAYKLFDDLIRSNTGDVKKYKKAAAKLRKFTVKYPMKTGYWTDGHTDTEVYSNTYKSNLSASNMGLLLFDHPEFDKNWKQYSIDLIKWTEKYFVERCSEGEVGNQWGANIVGEQDDFNHKMDYQTARYAAQCARLYTVTGDETYKEKAYRSLNWVTYCNDSTGKAYESPLSKGILSWWSDTYGECPRMFYHVFAAVPEWVPRGSNHILYSEGILKDPLYEERRVQYTAAEEKGTEYLRLAFKPSAITVNGSALKETANNDAGYAIRSLGDGDYSLTIKRLQKGRVIIE